MDINASLKPTKTQKNVTSKRRKRNRRKKGKGGQTTRAQGSNNPLTRNGIRGPVGQSLSSVQFTATSPLNLFEIRTGSSPGGIRVKGREMIGSVTLSATTTGAFQLALVNGNAAFNINPSSFPRLSAYTPIYEWYVFKSATIILQSNQPTTATGEWLTSIDYDVKDVQPASSMAMMRNISSSMANVYSDLSMVLLGNLSRLPRYVTAEGSSTDLDQVYQAICYVGLEGYTGTSGAAVGYCICEYDIELFTPQ